MKVYNADQVQIVVAGIPVTGGWGDGDFVSIESDEDAFSLVVGTDGEATRSRTNNKGATITLTLMQSSDVNDLLSALHALDVNSPGGAGIGPFFCRDGNGRSLYMAESCWIQKRPTAVFGREAGPREWVIRTDKLIAFDGGN